MKSCVGFSCLLDLNKRIRLVLESKGALFLFYKPGWNKRTFLVTDVIDDCTKSIVYCFCSTNDI